MPLIKMPALSPTMSEGKLSKWLVKVGDAVSPGDVIAEIETDKAVMEIEALDDGVVTTITVLEGSDGVAVGTVIAEILDEGEESQLSSQNSEEQNEVKIEGLVDKGIIENTQPILEDTSEIDMNQFQKKNKLSDRIFASPLAKRIANDRGFDLNLILGSGPKGRIIKRDVENYKVSASNNRINNPEVSPSEPIANSRLIENSQMRMIIAERLQKSKQDAPHFYLNIDINIDELLKARKLLNAQAPEDVKVSVNDMIIKAAAIALKRVPTANASWEGSHTRLWEHADISVAVAIEGGLVTPIISAAEEKGIFKISSEMSDLATRARIGKLSPEEYTGGSFTISNLGMYGITSFSAVINPPQGAILAIGSGEERPIVRNGELVIATMMTATLSCDHRVVDGAVGAEWLKTFKEIVENPVLALA